MTRPHIDKPQWSPEFTWSGVASLASFLSVVLGGLGLLWVASSTWAVAQTNIDALRREQEAIKEVVRAQKEEMDAKLVRVQLSTDRRLEVIHTDVQAIKNILIADRNRGD